MAETGDSTADLHRISAMGRHIFVGRRDGSFSLCQEENF